jgi:uncharacterized surface protein with fasciclin (FAS1) repeats
MKKYNNLFARALMLLSVLVLVVVVTGSCTKQKYVEGTTTDVLIADYLSQHKDTFSTFSRLLDTTNFSGFLNAWGLYTVFPPTNQAFATYFKSLGKSNLNDFALSELQTLVKVHVVWDTIGTSQFVNGRMTTKNMYGQYLTTGSGTDSKGNAVTLINGLAAIVKGNIHLTNGYVHEIDHVLTPYTATLAQLIEQTAGYTIFTQALKATGLYDTLNVDNSSVVVKTSRFYTLIANSDALYAKFNIYSLDDLDTYLHGDATKRKNRTDSLYMYMAYHCLSSMEYIIDLHTNATSANLTYNKLVRSRTKSDTIMMLNETLSSGVYSGGVPLVNSLSNQSASNGVMHVLGTPLDGKMPLVPLTLPPSAIFWEVTDQSEITTNTSVYRIPDMSMYFFNGGLANIHWVNGTAASTDGAYINYVVGDANSTNVFYNEDCLQMYSRDTYIPKLTFKTPFLVAGKYKVWVCTADFRQTAASYIVRGPWYYKPWVQADDDDATDVLTDTSYVKFPYGYTSSMNYTTLNNLTADQLESRNLKVYTIKSDGTAERGNPSTYGSQGFPMYGHLLGTMTVLTDGYIRLKFVSQGTQSLTSSTGPQFNLDMIHFIPELEDQRWPKFTRDGYIVSKDQVTFLTTGGISGSGGIGY